MQALSMIDVGAKTPEIVAPAKPVEPKGKQFGNVLKEQRQPEKSEPAEAKQQPTEAKQQPTEAKQQPTEAKQQPAEAKQQPAEKVEATQEKSQTVKAEQQPAEQPKAERLVAEKNAEAAEVAVEVRPQLQQTIMNLMKVIAGGETPELVEEFGSTEELLSQLVQQLEGSELNGEQVLAGVDLTTLVEQLQVLTAEGGEEQLAQVANQLGIQIDEQLVSEESLLANTELAAAMLPNNDPQATAPTLVENLAQARQVLQKAIDSVAAQKAPEVITKEAVVAEVKTDAKGQELLFGEETAEEIDPRFAGLLKPRSENRMQQQQSLRQQVQGENVKSNPEQIKAGETAQVVPELKPEQAKVDFAELLSSKPKQGLENLTQQTQGQAQPTMANDVQSVSGKVMPTTPMVQLPSGQQVAESQIFDQVVARFSSGINGGTKRMVLRMQPAELGSLKIELMVEGDRVRANLQAQSMQVQEVLERNLPQLRNALAEQGLKIDQFQVDVNKDQSQQQFEQMAQQQQERQGSQSQPRWQQSLEDEEQIIPLAHLMQNGGGGISLHV